MTREGEVADPKNLILGAWQSSSAWQNPSSEASARSPPIITSTWQFRADGLQLLTIPFRIDKGRYSIKDDSIRIEMGERPPVEGKVAGMATFWSSPAPEAGGSRASRDIKTAAQ